MNQRDARMLRIALAEQQAFERAYWDNIKARIRRAAEMNRDLTWETLGERFGLDARTIGRWCRDIPRDPAWWNNEGSRRSA